MYKLSSTCRTTYRTLPTVIPYVKLQSSKREPTAIAFNTNTSFIYMIVYDVQIFSRSMRIYSTYNIIMQTGNTVNVI